MSEIINVGVCCCITTLFGLALGFALLQVQYLGA